MPATKPPLYASTVTVGSMPMLTDYDVILLNTSGGKDSQVMMDVVVRLAKRLGIMDRVVAVHADLGEMEWEGTEALAREQAAFHGVDRFEVVRYVTKHGVEQNLLEKVLDRHETLQAQGKDAPAWPSSAARWCTSDLKRGPVGTMITKLTNERIAAGLTERPVRVLNVMGLRAQESCARAAKVAYKVDLRASNGKRQVDEWLPIHAWTEQMVWGRIKESGAPYHYAYDLGMGRLSCRFCVLASEKDLLISVKANPALAQEYVAVEELTGYAFKQGCSIASLVAKVAVAA